MTPFLFLLSLLFDVRGVVLDPSGRAVEGAQVACGSVTASTNSSGAFQLAGSQSCEAKVTKAGFAVETITLDPTKENQIKLTLATASERVVVSATAAPIDFTEAGISADIFTSKQLDIRQFSPVSDVLRDAGGLSVVQTG